MGSMHTKVQVVVEVHVVMITTWFCTTWMVKSVQLSTFTQVQVVVGKGGAPRSQACFAGFFFLYISYPMGTLGRGFP